MPGPASADTPSSSTDGGGSPTGKAPDVADPLDISPFVADPCLSLTAVQAQQLTVPAHGEPDDGALGKVCSWVNRDDFRSIDVSMFDKNPEGLAALYEANERDNYAFFEPLPSIEGFPAVAYDITDARDAGTCAVAVGVANDLAFEAASQLGSDDVGKKDPCEEAAAVAKLVMQTMKGS